MIQASLSFSLLTANGTLQKYIYFKSHAPGKALYYINYFSHPSNTLDGSEQGNISVHGASTGTTLVLACLKSVDNLFH